MKILLIRMYPTKMTTNNYNVQEIGLAKAFVKKGHICDIVSYNGSEKNEIKKIIVGNKEIINYCIPGKNRLKNCFFNEELFNIIKDYDIIQTEEYDQLQNLELVRKCNKRLFLYHGPYYNKFNPYNLKYYVKTIVYDVLFLNNKAYKRIPVFCKSKLAEQFLKKKGFKDITTVGVGLDMDKFSDYQNKKNAMLLLDFEKNNNLKYILYIGKIEPRRNTTFLIKIFAKLLKINPNIRLIIVGKGKKKYFNKCVKLIEKNKISDKIIYFESLNQEQLPYLYQNCNLFILPSNYEIFGMVMLESMYFGLPIITTLNGGSSTLIENGYNGIIEKSNKPDIWANNINSLITDKNRMKNISENAKKTILEHFTWDAISNKFVDIYNNSLKGDNNEKK